VKSLISSLCLLGCGAALSSISVHGESAAEAAWTLTPAVTSQYLFRGVRVAGACFQPGIDYSKGPLSLGLWASVGLEDPTSGDSDPEIDLYGSYSLAFRDGSVEVVPGFSLYTYPDARRSNGLYSATFEPSLAVNVEAKGIRFTPKCYYDVMLKGATFEFAATTAVPLKALGTELQLSASIGTFRWDDITAEADPDEKNWGDYWTVGVTLPYQISANGTVSLGVLYSEGRNNYFKQGTDPKIPNEDAVGRAAVTLSYSVTL
jgi:uncharacterized protein (TIGR02001 family)